MTVAEPVVLLVELTIRPDGMAQFLELAAEHARITRATEPGCLVFDVVRAGDNEVLIYEVYRDRAALDEHWAGAQIARFRAAAAEFIVERRMRELARVSDGRPGHRGKVLVAPPILVDRHDLLRPLEEAGLELVVNHSGRRLDRETLMRMLDGVVASIAGIEPYDDETLTAAPELRIIARLGVGHDQIDLPAATRHGVTVAMAFGTNHDAVADLAFTLMATLASNIVGYHQRVLTGGWGTFQHATLAGATVGLVGFGRIGRALAKRCQGFAMRVLVCDPVVDAAATARLGCELVPLDDLLAAADFVSLHAPLGPETHHLIGAGALARMKPTAYLINTARGALVDEAALIDALAAKRIAGAGLDVFEAEPLPIDSPLRRLDNVVLTPHVGGLSAAAIEAMARRCVTSILDHLAGREVPAGLLLNPEVQAGR